MVGSRNYFDTEIDGQYNIATAKRQPGSAFKPLVYALAFEKGYLPETILFDLPFEFDSGCSASHVPLYAGAVCYAPNNYTKTFQGTVPLKKALGSSLNIPAVQMLYMVGIDNAIAFAKTMGISTLDTKEPFGLSLVLGGAEVQLIELANAYGVFANGGIYRKENSVLSIQNSDKTMLEEYKPNEGTRVMSENTTQKMSDVLSDNTNRLLVFGVNNLLRVPGHNVAVKTGTTNNFKDAWILGYTSSVVIGAWAGNNDARPMVDKTGSTIAGPAWNKMMTYVLDTYPEQFPNPPFPKPAQEENYASINPVLRGTLPMYKSLLNSC
jgi:membrane carboxypeptidase/penicillin-binding protein PbpC